jgi:hypothetical protein
VRIVRKFTSVSASEKWLWRFCLIKTREAQEYGTRRRLRVDGFAVGMCAACRAGAEEAHPRAAIWGQKEKIKRFYWREIFKTKCELAEKWLEENGEPVKDILEFQSRFSDVASEIEKRARRYWQEQHKTHPKYDLSEITESQFLSRVNIPMTEIEARYVQIPTGSQNIGKWIGQDGNKVSAEEFAREWLTTKGFRVLKCERTLITCWFGALLADVVQDPSDPRQQECSRGSTRGWSPSNRNTPLISFLLPEDFGSHEYFSRRRSTFETKFEALNRVGTPLVALFHELLPSSETLRDYLWVVEDESVAIAREALEVLPPSVVLQCLRWVAENFWERQPGWPDLFVYNVDGFRFVEVKSPHDRLSQEQMQWFEWAVESEIPCELLRIKRASEKSAV